MVALMISTIRLAENEIQRRVTVSLKLDIFWVVILLKENFTVRAPKCRAHYNQSLTS